MRGVRWVSICVVLLPSFHSLTGDTDVFVLGPLPQGANYVTPQKNDTAEQKCNCNTVVFRYEIDPPSRGRFGDSIATMYISLSTPAPYP